MLSFNKGGLGIAGKKRCEDEFNFMVPQIINSLLSCIESIKCHGKQTFASRMPHHWLKAETRKSAERWRGPTEECWVFPHKFPPLSKRTLRAFPHFAVLFFHFGTGPNCSWAFHLVCWSYLVVQGLFVLRLVAAGWVDFDLKVGNSQKKKKKHLKA